MDVLRDLGKGNLTPRFAAAVGGGKLAEAAMSPIRNNSSAFKLGGVILNQKHENYESWLSELEVLADIEGVELSINIYDYHAYFMRGYLPVGVIEDINSLTT